MKQVLRFLIFFPAVLFLVAVGVVDLNAAAGNQSAFVSQTVPAQVAAGQTFSVTISFQNTGTTTWTASGYQLGMNNPADTKRWGPSRIALPQVQVLPGQNVTFTFNRTAPLTAGSYNFQTQMVQTGVGWFGAFSKNVLILVQGSAPSPTPTRTITRTATRTPTRTNTPVWTATRTPTRAGTLSQTATRTPTRTSTSALTATRTATRTSTATPPAGCNVANLPAPVAPPDALPPRHRIGVRITQGVGEFYDGVSGQKFMARGFNYVRLASQVGCYNSALVYHSTFNADTYNVNQIETALNLMQANGYNVARVFINSCCANGVGDAKGGLSGVYITHLADFLQRARAHNIQVILTTDSLPELGGYVAYANSNVSPQIQGTNRTYLAPNSILAQKRFWQDLIVALRWQNAPLDTILTYEIQNEAWFTGTNAPFTLTSGTFTPANGQTYDLSSPAAKLQMADAGIAYWVSEIRNAILQVDPTALVSVGFFATPRSDGITFSARYLPPNVMLANVSVGGAPVDWADVHLYPDVNSLPAYAHFMGFETPREKPVVLGEFGISKSAYTTANYAADGAQAWQTQSCPVNVTGWLFWTFDTAEQPGFWTAQASSSLIANVLSPALRPDPCIPWSALGANVALNRTASASVNSTIAAKVVDGAPMSAWTSGTATAPQWLEINLGTPRRVNQIRMVTQQSKSGAALHRVWRITADQPPELLFEYNGTTANGQVIDYTPAAPWENLQILRIETVTNPGPVGWREIELFSR